MFGLGWGEVVSLGTLVVVILNYVKTGISNTAHESNRKDMEDLNDKLTEFKLNVGELSSLLKQLNRDLSNLTKRVDRHGEEIDSIKIEIAKMKERIGINDDENRGDKQ